MATKYILKSDNTQTVSVELAETDTTIDHAAYGPILVSPGNYVLTYETSELQGQAIAITETDLNLQYDKAE